MSFDLTISPYTTPSLTKPSQVRLLLHAYSRKEAVAHLVP